MRYSFLLSALIGAAFTALFSEAGYSNAPGAPDGWPCIQRYVPSLSIGTFWPSELKSDAAWRDNPELLDIAGHISNREETLEESLNRVKQYLNAAEGDKRKAAEDLIRAMHEVVNNERTKVIEGIMRFAKRQEMMMQRIDRLSSDIEAAGNKNRPQAEIDDLEVRQKWDIRVFEDRERMIPYLCEQPVLLKKKFFGVGRAIVAMLDN